VFFLFWRLAASYIAAAAAPERRAFYCLPAIRFLIASWAASWRYSAVISSALTSSVSKVAAACLAFFFCFFF